MIAFVDESVKGDVFSLGVYVSRGNERAVRDFLAGLYTSFLRSHGLGMYEGELKFNALLMRVLRTGVEIRSSELDALFDRFVGYIRGLGYASAIITRDTKSICRVEDDLCEFLSKLKIRRPTIIKFLLVYHVVRGLRIQRIVFDGGFQISLRELKRILRALGKRLEFGFGSSIAEPGLEVADFIAGIAPYIKRRNLSAYITSSVRLYEYVL